MPLTRGSWEYCRFDFARRHDYNFKGFLISKLIQYQSILRYPLIT